MTETGGSRLRPADAPPLRTVFFDLGDTLMYVHPDVPTLYLQTCHDLGIDTTPGDMQRALHAGERLSSQARPLGSAPAPR